MEEKRETAAKRGSRGCRALFSAGGSIAGFKIFDIAMSFSVLIPVKSLESRITPHRLLPVAPYKRLLPCEAICTTLTEEALLSERDEVVALECVECIREAYLRHFTGKTLRSRGKSTCDARPAHHSSVFNTEFLSVLPIWKASILRL